MDEAFQNESSSSSTFNFTLESSHFKSSPETAVPQAFSLHSEELSNVGTREEEKKIKTDKIDEKIVAPNPNIGSTDSKILQGSITVLAETTSNNLPVASTNIVKKHPSMREILTNRTKAVTKCEWNMCVHSCQKMEKFLIHIAGHVALANGTPTHDGYICLWRHCGFATPSKEEFERHVYFHAFHAKIKGIGEIVMSHYGLQCTMDDLSRNMIPEIPDPFECMWAECRFSFISAQDFYWHVQSHVTSVEREDKFFMCSWQGCKYKGITLSNLGDHVRKHTQEKIVGCPNCGSIFSGNNKFQDHCYRHMSQELLAFECSHCKCKFATERLLKEHVRRHINHFKCPHCEMTCTTKGTMETHIKYRHTDNKPFQCPECTKRFKFQYDVVKHLTTHSAEASYVCIYPNCKYSCRAYSSYHSHIRKVHEGGHKNPYVCHMCDQVFSMGFKLTLHLKNVHNYHWPAGHTRFRYSKDEEGFYRLQTTRFESMELAQEILKENSDDAHYAADQNKDLSPDDPLSVTDSINDSPASINEEFLTFTEQDSEDIREDSSNPSKKLKK